MKKRTSGILLHITSLPSRFGIGDLGPSAYRFIDFLVETGQSYWQILPVNPTDQMSGNSPYSSMSAYGGNTLLVSPEVLSQWGLLTTDDFADTPPFPREYCDFPSVIPYKEALLAKAYDRFKETGIRRDAFEQFSAEHRHWLDDFALFRVIKRHSEGKAWGDWKLPLRDRNKRTLEKTREDFRDEMEKEKFQQYLFHAQWAYLRSYCNERGIRIIGDLPIYVSYDSVDVWTHPRYFQLDKVKRPTFVSGVPPDYFSSTGQLWGNPTYRWDAMKKDDFAWWLRRFEHNLLLFDAVRIDHFRGFVGFWEVPAGEKTAINGQWAEAPAIEFFAAITERFPGVPFIAEDLGIITDDVREIMVRFGFPGMRILLFAFHDDNPAHSYLPHNYTPDCVVYTGTHDNNTSRGWFENEAGHDEKQRLFRYMGRKTHPDNVSRELIRLVMLSAANTVIFPMQDVIGLGEWARMNHPSVAKGNWVWRLLPEQLTEDCSQFLKETTHIYGRGK